MQRLGKMPSGLEFYVAPLRNTGAGAELMLADDILEAREEVVTQLRSLLARQLQRHPTMRVFQLMDYHHPVVGAGRGEGQKKLMVLRDMVGEQSAQ